MSVLSSSPGLGTELCTEQFEVWILYKVSGLSFLPGTGKKRFISPVKLK